MSALLASNAHGTADKQTADEDDTFVSKPENRPCSYSELQARHAKVAPWMTQEMIDIVHNGLTGHQSREEWYGWVYRLDMEAGYCRTSIQVADYVNRKSCDLAKWERTEEIMGVATDLWIQRSGPSSYRDRWGRQFTICEHEPGNERTAPSGKGADQDRSTAPGHQARPNSALKHPLSGVPAGRTTQYEAEASGERSVFPPNGSRTQEGYSQAVPNQSTRQLPAIGPVRGVDKGDGSKTHGGHQTSLPCPELADYDRWEVVDENDPERDAKVDEEDSGFCLV